MLVLGRKENESILIGENIRITIVGRSGSSIRIGVQAPDHVKVLRGEIATQPATNVQSSAAEVACLPMLSSPPVIAARSA